jgi:hypothetical protein
VEEHTTNTVSNSSHTFQIYDGKMPSIPDARDYESDRYCILVVCLKTDDFVLDSEIDVHRNSSTERLMWAILVVPIYIERNLPSDGILTQRNENSLGAFVFYGPHQSFNNGDTSVLANSAKALFDTSWFCTAPHSEMRCLGALSTILTALVMNAITSSAVGCFLKTAKPREHRMIHYLQGTRMLCHM